MESFVSADDARLAFSDAKLAFAFPRGAITALIGHNGAGKTTLLRAILGEPVLRSGDIFIGPDCRSVRTMRPADFAREIAFVPQEHVYPPDLRLRDMLALALLPRLGMFGRRTPEHDAEIERVIASFALEKLADRPLRRVSTGERQRAFLARALLQRPRLLLLDEPTNHLDPAAVAAFWETLLTKREELGFDVLASTHDLAFVEKHCAWVAALKNGALVYSGETSALWSSGKLADIFGASVLSTRSAPRS